MSDDPFDDVVSDEEVDAEVRRRILYDDALFEREWARHGPQPPPGKVASSEAYPARLDDPLAHRRHLTVEEAAAQKRAAAKGMPRLFSGRY